MDFGMFMRKVLSSIILIMTAMVLFCGCGNNNTEENEKKEDSNYCTEMSAVKPISVRTDVISMKDINPSNIDKSGAVKLKEARLTNDSTLLVTYTFNNKESYSRSLYGLLDCGSLSAYQEGVEISGSYVGDIDAFTDVMSGAIVDIKKEYSLRNSYDPITLHTYSTHLFWGGETFIHKELEIGTSFDEKFVKNSSFQNEITGASLSDDGKIMVRYTFTNNQEKRTTPATAVAVQAFQGENKLSIVGESMTDETHNQKFYYVEQGQKVELSTTFRLNNNEENVTVYLTVPETAEIYAKQSYKAK